MEIINKIITNKTISNTCKLIYLYLYDKHLSNPSHPLIITDKSLAEIFDCSRMNANQNIKLLGEAGLIMIDKTEGARLIWVNQI
jgi:hypothetical protein